MVEKYCMNMTEDLHKNGSWVLYDDYAQLQATIKDRDLLIVCIKDVIDEERNGKNTTGHTLAERISFLLGDIKKEPQNDS